MGHVVKCHHCVQLGQTKEVTFNANLYTVSKVLLTTFIQIWDGSCQMTKSEQISIKQSQLLCALAAEFQFMYM